MARRSAAVCGLDDDGGGRANEHKKPRSESPFVRFVVSGEPYDIHLDVFAKWPDSLWSSLARVAVSEVHTRRTGDGTTPEQA